MGTINNKIGLKKHARSPGSIDNAEHHDPSRAKRVIKGSASNITSITNDASEHAVPDNSIIRVANDTGGTVYVWVGDAGSAPGTVDSTNGIAIPNGTVENLFMGVSEDSQVSQAYKLSAAAQVVVSEG